MSSSSLPAPPAASAQAAPSQSTAPTSTAPNSRALFFMVFPSIMLPMFMAAIDQTIVSTALPAIAGQLGDVERISWVVVSYLVAGTIAAPVYGRLGDVLGRRRLMFIALGVFVTASVLCAIAPSVLALSAARVLQGLGGGGLMTLSQALVGQIVPPRERGRYQGYLASVFVCSSTFGPVAGGWLTQHWGWQSVFLINIPLGAGALFMATRLPKPTLAGGRFTFDYIGLGLFACFIAPLLLGLEQAQRFDLATMPYAVVLFAIAAGAITLLVRQEKRASVPLLPVNLLRQATIWRCDAMAACNGAMIVSFVTFIPIYLQVVRGTDASATGVLLLPFTMFIAVGSLATGQIITRTGRTAIVPSCCLPIAAVALASLAILAPYLTMRQLPMLFCLISLTSGTAMSVVQTTVQSLAGPKQLGAAAASVQFSRSIGAAVGAALTGAVLFGMLFARNAETAHLFGRLVEMGPAALQGITGTRLAGIRADIADAFRAAFLTIAAYSACGAFLAWSLPVRRIQ